MEFKVLQEPARVRGTGFLAYMDIGYADLVATLGEPGASDGYKVDAEWILEFPAPDRTVATIYNYKTGRNYLGPTAPGIYDIRDWHIGGRDQRAVDCVAALFPQATVSGGRIFRAPAEPQGPEAVRKQRAQAIIAALAEADIPHDTMTGEALVALGKELIAEHTPEAGQPDAA
jgi:hypothetical protein